MINGNLYLTVPLCALCGYLFLLFSFFNAPPTKPITYFKAILISCLCWTGGACLMRLQVMPGIRFWFHVSIAGLLLIPGCIFFFLFYILEIDKKRQLCMIAVVNAVMAAINVIWEPFIAPPEVITNADGTITYHYVMPAGVYILAVVETVIVGYVVLTVCRKIKGNLDMIRKMVPLLVGIFCILLGNLLVMLIDSDFPFDTLGGIIMAVIFAHIMYKRYLFSLPQRATTGAVYMVATMLVVISMGMLSRYVEQTVVQYVGSPDKILQMFLVTSIWMAAWIILIFWCAWLLTERYLRKQNRSILQKLKEFQEDTVALFGEAELNEMIISTVQEMFPEAKVHIYRTNKVPDKGFTRVCSSCNSTEKPDAEKERKLTESFDSGKVLNQDIVSLMQRDEETFGFIYLEFPKKAKLNYLEKECFRQIGIYAAVCLKNIEAYQTVYNISIHDELTGLYNRSYFKEYLQKHFDTKASSALMYLDMDDFKLINELYGENMGDCVLKWCADVIRKTVGENGLVFRLGSNEYIIYFSGKSKEELLDFADRLRHATENMEAEDRPGILQPIHFSIGISLSDEKTASGDELLSQTEKAIFFAKRNGKNRVEFYVAGLETEEADITNHKEWYEQVAPTIYALTAAIDAKDSYTFRHSCHVSEYAVMLGKAVGLNANEIQIIKEAGLLHDIGKIGIPEEILKKKGKLNDEEYECMKNHVTNSIEMIHFLPNMSYVIPAVLSHHERYDGKGYPRGLAGENIPYPGRILTVCDSFDAMTTKRVYNTAKTMEEAKEELIRNKGTQFDPKLVDAFVKLIEKGKITLEEAESRS